MRLVVPISPMFLPWHRAIEKSKCEHIDAEVPMREEVRITPLFV